jgi:hypothetical protein
MANKHFCLGYFIACILLSVLGSSALGQEKVPATTEEARSAFENADAELNAVYHQCTEPDLRFHLNSSSG